MAHLMQCIVDVKAEENYLAHGLVMAIAKVDKDLNYKAYIQGRNISPVDQNLFETTGIELSKCAGIPELGRFHDHYREKSMLSTWV